MKEIGQPLESHRNAWELVRVLKHTLKGMSCSLPLVVPSLMPTTAHQQAYKLNILHHDISAKNILIFVYINKNGKKKL